MKGVFPYGVSFSAPHGVLPPAISPNIRNLHAYFGVVTACVYTLSCSHFSHEIVIPLICSEQNIIKNIKIDLFNLILYIQKNPEWECVEPAVIQVKVVFPDSRRQRRAGCSSVVLDHCKLHTSWLSSQRLHRTFLFLSLTFFSNPGKITSFWARLKWSNLFI